MSNWRIVDHPHLAPYKCVACPSAGSKPMIDTLVDIALLPQGGRVYLCRNCAKLAAEMFGFAPGEAYEELLEAATLLEEQNKALGDAKDMLAKKDELIESEHYARVELQDENARVRQQNDQLQATLDEIRGVASSTQETTGGA